VPRVHETAIVELGVELGEGTTVWDSVHIRAPSRVGAECIIGEKTYIAYGVQIGSRVKINAFVYICTGVTIEDGVMVAAGTIFTNDAYPRATTPDIGILLGSEPTADTRSTTVGAAATIGARSVIGPGVDVGRFAMVGMGAVVTRSVPEFHFVAGHPAITVGWVCRCGRPFARLADGHGGNLDATTCRACGLRYSLAGGVVTEHGVAV
jgi:UDP-2-acetamido-3-amino-2,3-dideoxy-glucuronate N-acetyltransferase